MKSRSTRSRSRSHAPPCTASRRQQQQNHIWMVPWWSKLVAPATTTSSCCTITRSRASWSPPVFSPGEKAAWTCEHARNLFSCFSGLSTRGTLSRCSSSSSGSSSSSSSGSSTGSYASRDDTKNHASVNSEDYRDRRCIAWAPILGRSKPHSLFSF